MKLNTVPEFDQHGELTPHCVADIIDEIHAAYHDRAQVIRDALLRMKQGDTLNMTMTFQFGAKAE